MNLVFDSVIFFILFFSGYWMYVIIHSFFYDKHQKNDPPKTKLVRITILFFLLLCFSTIFWGSLIEPRLVTVKTTNLDLKKINQDQGFKIGFLSDQHLGKYKKTHYTQKVVNKTLEQKPDLILLGGDFIENQAKAANYLLPMEKLCQTVPCFAVMGNHEYNLAGSQSNNYKDKTALIKKYFDEWKIPILFNQTQNIKIKENNISISGTDDLWTGRVDITKLSQTIDPKNTNILLSHNPDIILKPEVQKFDLIFSGHTHGGQIRLPWLGSLAKIPTKIGQDYDKGLFKTKNGYLYITAGLGESGVRSRLFNPPEISIINIY